MKRRAFLASALAALSWQTRAFSDSGELERHDLQLAGDRNIARRALLLLPRTATRSEPLRLLVLLHGLGETGNELAGINAWAERYGLVECYRRLVTAPVARVLDRERYLTDETLERLNASLAARPFRGLAIACPVTPNPHRGGPASRTLDIYANWIEDELLPAVRNKTNIARGASATGLDGCSLGGYVALEIFLRKPELFGTLGIVQGAFGVAGAERYAHRLATTIQRVGPRPVHIETSSHDPYREPSERLARELSEREVPNRLEVFPGPHNQPWLREVGTLAMLLWHDRQLLIRRRS